MSKKVYNFKVMAKCMTIDEFHRLPEDVQEKYLTWSMQHFLRERRAILIERTGGVAVVAKQLVEARAMHFDYLMSGNYGSLRLRTRRGNRFFYPGDMFNSSGNAVLSY